jgi:hypothetical protein
MSSILFYVREKLKALAGNRSQRLCSYSRRLLPLHHSDRWVHSYPKINKSVLKSSNCPKIAVMEIVNKNSNQHGNIFFCQAFVSSQIYGDEYLNIKLQAYVKTPFVSKYISNKLL